MTRTRVLSWAQSLLIVAMVVISAVFLVGAGDRASRLLNDLFFLAVPAVYGGVGAVLTARRPENSVGWLSLLIGLVWGVNNAGDALCRWAGDHGHDTLASWAGLSDPMWVLAVGLTIHLALRLPTGRLLSRAWRHFSRFTTIASLAVFAVPVTMPGQVYGIAGTDNPLGSSALQPFVPLYGLVAVALLGSIASLVLRYRRGDALERLQIRWIAAAGVLILLVGGTLLVLTVLGALGTTDGLPPAAGVPDTLANVAIPISIGIAVLRYRLYEIDVVINRTLVYGLLTATLAATYIGLVVVFQVALSPLPQDSRLATAASTLAVAALFRPARARIQETVDRRFFRSKYDAARTLEAFGARLRDEVDLETLTDDLRSVVSETMQPAHVSLWLRTTR
jgi:hypothetical protein